MTDQPGAISYAVAALAFALLTIVLLTRWRSRLQGSMLSVASAASAVWAGALAFDGLITPVDSTALVMLEILRDGAWLNFLLRVLSMAAGRRLSPWWPRLTYGALIAAAMGTLAAAMVGAFESALGRATVLTPIGMLVSIVGLVLVDQVYRNTREGHEWALKFLWIGVGGLFAYDLVLYGTALMFRALPAELWDGRGAAQALLVLPLAVGAQRVTRWTPRQFLSQRFYFYATGLFAIGIYLVAMSAAGYYIRIFGGSWGGFAQVVFLTTALLLLIVLAFSGQLRASARVFIAKHFSPYRYDYRVEWLRLVRTLSAPDAEGMLPERAVRAVAQIVNSDGGGVWLCRDGRVFEPVGGDLAGPDSPREPARSPFATFMAEREWVAEIDGVGMRPGVPEAPVPEWLRRLPRAWLVVPLLQETQLIGFVVVARPLAQRPLTWEDIDLLRAVGRQVAGYFALDEAGRMVSEARQFEAYNRFSAFIAHDLKNVIAQQRLVVENAARHKGNPAFVDDAIETIDNSVRRMGRLLELLRGNATDAPARRTALAPLLRDIVALCQDRAPRPRLLGDIGDLHVLVNPDRLTAAVENAIRNAQDATPPEGDILVELRREGRMLAIEIADNGVGMKATFVRDQLFRPFFTTKGSQGMGVGAYQTREFARAAGGDVTVHSVPGAGTRFIISLPVAADD